jgi:hypothetical protein
MSAELFLAIVILLILSFLAIRSMVSQITMVLEIKQAKDIFKQHDARRSK